MDQENHINCSAFTEIKTNLDPGYSYLLFERAGVSDSHLQFENIEEVLSKFKRGILEYKHYFDRTKGALLLTVKLDPEHRDDIIEKLINIGWPEDIMFYIYHHR